MPAELDGVGVTDPVVLQVPVVPLADVAVPMVEEPVYVPVVVSGAPALLLLLLLPVVVSAPVPVVGVWVDVVEPVPTNELAVAAVREALGVRVV